jgi:hypothetical protein
LGLVVGFPPRDSTVDSVNRISQGEKYHHKTLITL